MMTDITDAETLRITAESNIFMNTCSDEELFAAEHRILEICREGHAFCKEELYMYEALIISLMDNAYLGRIRASNLEEIYTTTEAGTIYDERVKNHTGTAPILVYKVISINLSLFLKKRLALTL